MYKYVAGFILGILLALLAMQFIGKSPPGEVPMMRDTITIQFDSIQVRDSIVYRWKKSDPIYLKSVDTLLVSLNGTDSLLIANAIYSDLVDYNNTYTYLDTLKNDSIAFIQLKEMVQQNRINGRELVYRNNLKQYIPRQKGLYGQMEVGQRMLNIGLRLDLGQKFDYIVGYQITENNWYVGFNVKLF